MTTLTVNPHAGLSASLLLTAITPISHGDPARGKEGNITSFNRIPQRITGQTGTMRFPAKQLAAICDMFSVPVPLVGAFEALPPREFVGAAIVKIFLDEHNTSQGIGHFEGMTRYHSLAERLVQAAVRSHSFLGFWGALSDMVGVGPHSASSDEALVVGIAGLPVVIQEAIVSQFRSSKLAIALLSLGRLWHDMGKKTIEAYALKAGLEQALPTTHMSFPDSALAIEGSGGSVVSVPRISTNDVRHQLRDAGLAHFLHALEIGEGQTPGYGSIPDEIASTFENGGNLAEGAKQPSYAFTAAAQIREKYPLLALFGGNVRNFGLGTSDLGMYVHLVCRENEPALLPEIPRENLLSAFDLLADVTETRHHSQAGLGQMIRTFEVLVQGTELQVVVSLSPTANALTKGALVAAIGTWQERSKVAGQSARGFGHMKVDVLAHIPDAAECLAEYEAYLLANAEELRAGLFDGTLGTGHNLV